MTFSKQLWGLARTLTFAVPVTVTFLDWVGYVAKVEGASMQPVLNPEDSAFNDFVLLNRWSVRNFNISRGEIVSLSSPRDPDQKIIKRVIAIEGDVVNVLGYKRCYVKIPEGHCWVEGDHHGQSMDSNFFGPVAIALIYAKASHIVWPPHRWQALISSSQDHRITPRNNFIDLTMFDDDCPDRISNTPVMKK